jgi:endoglucanase
MTSISRRAFVAGCAGLAATRLDPAVARTAPQRKLRLGVNLAGAEFKAIGGRWKWPQVTNLDYYLAKGFNVFRIPFRWSRLQPALGGRLDETALQGLDRLVRTATAAGAVVLLDCHDYGRRDDVVIGTPGQDVTTAAFANFWGQLAGRYRGNPLVWFNLMNEPHDQDAQLNLQAQNEACAAIRRAGARAKVLFSGTNWTGARSWVKSGNASVMLGARDPANNYGFDVHQYLGKGHLKPEQVPGIGNQILSAVYDWGRAHDKMIFLGEFGVDRNPLVAPEVAAMLSFMKARTDVFLGATYFAGGGTWGRNPNSADPIDGVDKPQTIMMQKMLRDQ